MDPLLAMFGGLVLFFAVFAAALGARPAGRRISDTSHPDYGAQAEIEAHDIDQMIEARNDLRRRTGRPQIGDELAAELHEQLNERRLEGR